MTTLNKDENKVWPDTVWRQSSLNELNCECDIQVLRSIKVALFKITDSTNQESCRFVYVKVVLCIHECNLILKQTHLTSILSLSSTLKNHILIQVPLSTWWNVQTKHLHALTRKFYSNANFWVTALSEKNVEIMWTFHIHWNFCIFHIE